MVRLFIAYPFRPEAQEIVDRIIRPVLQRQGVRYVTGADKDSSGGDVAECLRESIANCSALVAIVTGRNPNVFFEIGVASALAKPCLLLASAASDATMLEGTYPVIMVTPAERATQELESHLSLWRLVEASASATA